MSKKDQLMIPETALNDANSFELMRIWIADKGQHVSLRADVWEDPAAWGIMLTDLVRHIVNSYRFNTEDEKIGATLRIRAAMTSEFDSPTE